MKANINIKKYIIALVVIVIAGGAIYYLWQWQRAEIPAPAPVVGFDELEAEFNRHCREAMVAAWQSDNSALEEASVRAFQAWQKILKRFPHQPPHKYYQSLNWSKQSELALYHLEQAAEQAISGNSERAVDELAAARLILGGIKSANQLVDINQDLQELREAAQLISQAENKAANSANLEKIKLLFTRLKEYRLDDDYDALIDEFEKNIRILDKSLDGPDYWRAQAELLNTFYRLYLKYG